MTKDTFIIIVAFLFFSVLNAQKISNAINSKLLEKVSKGELLSTDKNWNLTKNHISSISSVHHIYFNQSINKISIDGTNSSIHILKNGEIVSNINFIKNTAKKTKGNFKTSITAMTAVEKSFNELGTKIFKPLNLISKEDSNSQKTIFNSGDKSENNIIAELEYNIVNENELLLVWKVSFLDLEKMHHWEFLVNGMTGAIIYKQDLVIKCNFDDRGKKNIHKNSISKTANSLNKPKEEIEGCEECYEVFAMPLVNAYYGERSIVVNPSNNNASPYGWHDIDGVPGGDFFTTNGNNINAHIGNGENYQPYGGELLNFTGYNFDQEFSEEERYEESSVTNLFYWANISHDVLYNYGFNEVAGNFQENNYGNGGLDGDQVIARSQREIDLCNAYFVPLQDGNTSYINMNACNNKDGSYDNLVIVHEYAHGLTTRLIGLGGWQCQQEETPWEGWSDWYGLMLTMSPDDLSETPRSVATYLLNQGEGGNGIRPFPYSTNMDINPQTYDYIKTYNNIHNVGSVWASTLWELTWILIEQYGYDPNIYNFTGDINQDAGNVIALAIVTEGLKFTNCSSGFVDARRAIFRAFNAIYENEPDCFLWEAFAKRGLGIYAVESDPDNVTDGFESFDLPPTTAEFYFELYNICPNENILTSLSGGFPLGGVYGGLGVIDDGNGYSFSFDPSIAGVGLQVITYEVLESNCTNASIAQGTIEVINDTEAPVINCPEDYYILLPPDTDQYTLLSLGLFTEYSDNCANTFVTITQTPVYGTLLDIGVHLIEVDVEDDAGNLSSCSFNVIVEQEARIEEQNITVFPNPTNSDLSLTSVKEIEELNLKIFDINGRLIIAKDFRNFGFNKIIKLKNLATGMYFLKINTEDLNFVKRIIKN